jgi:hypothetical protein
MHKRAIMHSSVRKLVPLALAIAAGACDDDDDNGDFVTTRSSPSADFTSFRTFRFLTEDDVPLDTAVQLPAGVSANLAMVDDAMRDELLDQGLVEVAPTEPADLLAFSLERTAEQDALYWECAEGYWWGYWSFAWAPCGWLEPVYTEYETGTVFVGLVDPVRDEIVYGSLMEGVINGDHDDVADRLEDDMEVAFTDYPATQTGF